MVEDEVGKGGVESLPCHFYESAMGGPEDVGVGSCEEGMFWFHGGTELVDEGTDLLFLW